MAELTAFGIHAARFFADKESFDGDIVTLSDSDSKHITHVLRMSEGERITICDGECTDYTCELIFNSESANFGGFVNSGGRTGRTGRVGRVGDGGGHGRRESGSACHSARAGREGCAGHSVRSVRARIVDSAPSIGEPLTKVTLWQSVPRSDKFDFITQKCVEAGVTAIVPVMSERTQVILGGTSEGRVARWRRICYEAAKQSGRGIVPEVRELVSFSSAIDYVAACVKKPRTLSAGSNAGLCTGPCVGLIPYERETDMTLKAALKALRDSSADMDYESHSHTPIELHLFIGSEGGYSQAEIDIAARAGIVPVTLGKRIFRAETAGLAAICCILYELDSI